MNNQERPTIKQIIDYHLTSSLVRIASFSDYCATTIDTKDIPVEEQQETSESSEQKEEAKAEEIHYGGRQHTT